MSHGNLKKVFNRYNKKVAQYAGREYDILRPTYTRIDNSGDLIQEKVNFFIDVGAGKYAEPVAPGTFYYDVYGPRNLLLPGDILQLSVPDGASPAVTILGYSPMKACIGLMSDRTGEIHDDLGDVIYSNILFHFVGHSSLGAGLDPEVQATLKLPDKRAVVYQRDGIVPKMRLVQTDQNKRYRWIIEHIHPLNNIMILSLSEDDE